MKKMVVEIFKTNVRSDKDASNVIASLLAVYPAYKINFDLEDEDNILRVEAHQLRIEIHDVIKYTVALGYRCERIK